jgi:hypothetical protein
MATPPSSVKYVKAVWFKNSEHKAVEIQVIPRAWVFKGVDKVYWPSHNIKEHRLEGSKPGSDWSHYDLVHCSNTADSIEDAEAQATDALPDKHDDGITGDELFESEDSNVEATQTTRSGRRIKNGYLQDAPTEDDIVTSSHKEQQMSTDVIGTNTGERHKITPYVGETQQGLVTKAMLKQSIEVVKGWEPLTGGHDPDLECTVQGSADEHDEKLETGETVDHHLNSTPVASTSGHRHAGLQARRSLSLSPSLSLETSYEFPKPDDSGLEQHRFNKRVYSMLTTLTKHLKTGKGQEVILRRLGTNGDHVLERVVELEASLPCTTHSCLTHKGLLTRR